jgi:small-conductance mechanosensitive channel
MVVPDAKLAQAIVGDPGHVERVVMEVGRDVMTQVAGGMPEFEALIRDDTFDESSIDFTVILRAKEFVDQSLVKHEFVKRLHARFTQEGIVIPFPIRTVARRDAMPEDRAEKAAGAA